MKVMRAKKHKYDFSGFSDREESLIREAFRYLQKRGTRSALRMVASYFKFWFDGVKKLLRNVLGYIFIQFRKKPVLYFQGENIPYLYRLYNTTWRNERSVEIPIALHYVQNNPDARILEVGNVLAHYVNATWDIIDKYEIAPHVQNIDVMNFLPREKYDLIVSISTLEHVGLDEEDQNPDKSYQSIQHLKERCLVKDGKLVFTMPLGYNRGLDAKIKDGSLQFDEKYFFCCNSSKNAWDLVSEAQAWTLSPESGLSKKCFMLGVLSGGQV